MNRPSYCKADCGAQIQWGITDKGHRMPVDMVASDDGNIVWEADGQHIHVLTRAEKALPVSRPRFLSHFVSCPNRTDFKRKGRAS